MRKIFLGAGILLLGLVTLLLISCGSIGDSMIKALAQAGAYAVIFPVDNPNSMYISAGGSENVAGYDVTVEAWVKSIQDDDGNETISGTVFVRGVEGAGFILYVNNNLAKFGTSSSVDDISTFYEVSSDSTSVSSPVDCSDPSTSEICLNDGIWHHIAGVLVGPLPIDQVHNHTVTDTCDADAMSATHMDIYVDGIWKNCVAAVLPDNFDDCGFVQEYDETEGVCLDSDTPASCPMFIGRDLSPVGSSTTYIGTMDEIRFWREARTAEQIATWRTTEITADNWSQANPNNALSGYWKMNEGSGNTAMDSSGYGHTGTIVVYSGSDDECGFPIDFPACNEPVLDEAACYESWVEGYSF